MIKLISFAALLTMCSIVGGCQDDQSGKVNHMSDRSYEPSGAPVSPMVFPGLETTVFKEYGRYKDPELPQPYKHGKEWVIYMASPGWTNEGEEIVTRLATDAAAVGALRNFLRDNNLNDKVKVAWLQYDKNPSAQYVESYSKIPDNFIPLFLKPHGPFVDYYIHSAASRYGKDDKLVRYDLWLKPYIHHAIKKGNDFTTEDKFHIAKGFNKVDSEYWDSWARHWFIVNPDGNVVDAYLSNIGNSYIHGIDSPIFSIIHHLKLDADNLSVPKAVTYRYESYYGEPYWNKVDREFRENLGMNTPE